MCNRGLYHISVFVLCVVWALLLLSRCTSTKQAKESVTVYADISFKPLIDQQVLVFNSLFSHKQHTQVVYTTESVCMEKLRKGEASMVISSKKISEAEREYIKDQKLPVPSSYIIGYDAVVLILPTSASQTKFTLAEMEALLENKSKTKYLIAVEGKSTASCLRHLMEVLQVEADDIKAKIFGFEKMEDIIAFVKKYPNSIGIIGSQYITRMDEQVDVTLKKLDIQVADIFNAHEEKYIAPLRGQHSFGKYPLVRPIYYSSSDVITGPGLRLGRFMTNEQGQLICRRSHVLPAHMDFNIRQMNLK